MSAQRNFGLDLLRALAISMVFLSHGVTALETLGVGVDLFFVLSGFLIGRIYLRAQADAHEPRGSFTLWSFWSARWFRTLPPYFAALALFDFAQHWFHNNPVRHDYLLFLQNYVGMGGRGLCSPTSLLNRCSQCVFSRRSSCSMRSATRPGCGWATISAGPHASLYPASSNRAFKE